MSVETVTQTANGSSPEHLTSASYQNNPYPVPDSQREPLVLGNPSIHDVTEKIAGIVEGKTNLKYWLAVLICASIAGLGFGAIGETVTTGIGVWGSNNTIGWAWDITNFVFWIGIGHAGTLISAILYLFRQKWRTAINRSAEAMTIFAVMCAGIFPVIHTGRPWFAYWLTPYPNQMQLWVNFRSPLVWDVFAVSTYLTVSALFWFIGLVPDLATIRNYVKGKTAKSLYTFFSFGWTGSMRAWHHYEIAYMILAGLSTPLVLSVHTIVSMDFATSVLPGWHTTIFPPYFVAGAIFSGFAMVMTLLVIAREILGLKDYITLKHLENMNKIILATGMMVGYAYSM
jgi:molybdopterin-containing oxidoreductase family membrane subunit